MHRLAHRLVVRVKINTAVFTTAAPPAIPRGRRGTRRASGGAVESSAVSGTEGQHNTQGKPVKADGKIAINLRRHCTAVERKNAVEVDEQVFSRHHHDGPQKAVGLGGVLARGDHDGACSCDGR